MRTGSSGFYRLGFVALLVIAAAACGDSGNNNNTADVGVTSAALKGVDVYAQLQGSATIETTTTGAPSKIELLADGKVVATATSAPFALSFDTTAVKDGIVELSLRCDDQAMDGKVKVVVLNNGQAVSFSDGTGGTISVPADGNYLDQHLKYHWTMPKSVKRIVGVVTWADPAFEIELSLGMGECPDNGTVANSASSKDSPLAVTFGESAELTAGMWFAHVTYLNKKEAATFGKNLPFKIKAYLLVD